MKAFDAKNKLNAGVDREKAIAAAHRVMVLRRRVTSGEGVTLKELIDEGRR